MLNSRNGQDTGALTWIITDQLGSTTALANEDGSLKTLLRYTAFGEIRAAYGSDQATDYRYHPVVASRAGRSAQRV